jgi:hypothetical protein
MLTPDKSRGIGQVASTTRVVSNSDSIAGLGLLHAQQLLAFGPYRGAVRYWVTEYRTHTGPPHLVSGSTSLQARL